MGRKNHNNQRSNLPRPRSYGSEAFAMFRPVVEEDAELLHEICVNLYDKNKLPPQTEMRPTADMRVTYIEKHRLTRQLRGFAEGWSARDTVRSINDECPDFEDPLEVALGRVSMMDRHEETVVARTDHNQIIAQEYDFTKCVLTRMRVPAVEKMKFRPHISLLTIPGITFEERRDVTAALQTEIPDAIQLGPMDTFPSYKDLR